MKPNQIKMVISKQQETQHRTHSCHFPATSCGRLGEGQFVYRWRWWKLWPPPTPLRRRIQVPHSSKLHKGCLLLALTSGSRDAGKEREDARAPHRLSTETGIPFGEDFLGKESLFILPLSFRPHSNPDARYSCIKPHLKSRGFSGAPGPQAGRAQPTARPSLPTTGRTETRGSPGSHCLPPTPRGRNPHPHEPQV